MYRSALARLPHAGCGRHDGAAYAGQVDTDDVTKHRFGVGLCASRGDRGIGDHDVDRADSARCLRQHSVQHINLVTLVDRDDVCTFFCGSNGVRRCPRAAPVMQAALSSSKPIPSSNVSSCRISLCANFIRDRGDRGEYRFAQPVSSYRKEPFGYPNLRYEQRHRQELRSVLSYVRLCQV